ncbi:protein kinase domain-containing protein [Legionella sp. WA2022007384]
MFKKLFQKPPQKVSPKNTNQDVVIKPTLIQQKELMGQNLPLLNDIQIQMIIKNIKQCSSPPPFCLKSTDDVPFRTLYDGANIYVLSEIVLGEGGEGVMMAGLQIDEKGMSNWLAIKECFPGRDLRDMIILFVTDDDKFLENYEHMMRIMYLEKYPDADYDELNQDELVEFFKKRLATEIIPQTKERSLQDALKNQAILEHLGIPATAFATDLLVYSTMPLLRGSDLVMLTGAKESNPTAIFEEIKNSVETNPDAPLQWGSFVAGYAQVIDNIMEQVAELHRKNYLHRDIKPQNFMLTDTAKVQLIDFGSAVKMHEGVYTANDAKFGTPGYISPQQAEVVEFHPTDDYNFTRADDIYSLGVTLHELHAQHLVEAISNLYPDLKERVVGIQHALADLKAHEPETRLHAMSYLNEHFKHLVQALEVKQGLVLQHDDNYERLVAHIDRYRIACYESNCPTDDVSLIIDGIEFSSKFAYDLLSEDVSSEDIASNLLTIKQECQAKPEITVTDVIASITHHNLTT